MLGILTYLWSMLMSYLIGQVVAFYSRPKDMKPAGTDEIQYPTMSQGLPFGVVFGTPARIAHTHVVWNGFLNSRAIYNNHVVIAWEYDMTVHLALCRSGIDGIKSIFFRDTAVWPSQVDWSAVAADGASSLSLDLPELWGSMQGGVRGNILIFYGIPTQPVPDPYYDSYGSWTKTATSSMVSWHAGSGRWLLVDPSWAGHFDILTSAHTFKIGPYTGRITEITDGINLYISGLPSNMYWPSSFTYTIVRDVWVWEPPATRGVVTLVLKDFYWGRSPVFPIVSYIAKRTLHLTDGDDQWYVAKADINGDLNPVHILRECLLDQTWGDHRDASELGTTWTGVADDVYSEGIGLSFFYVPEPGKLQEFVENVLKHFDGFIYQDSETGKIEIGMIRNDYVVEDLDSYDESDFEIVDFLSPSWKDMPGRVVVRYANRIMPENTNMSVPYDDLSIQMKQGGSISEQVIDLPGITSETVADKMCGHYGRNLCRLYSAGTMRCKASMANLHRGSVVRMSYNIPDLQITQMVIRITNVKRIWSEEEAVVIDFIEDAGSSLFTIFEDTPEVGDNNIIGYWNPSGFSKLETEGVISGTSGVGSSGVLIAEGAISGTSGVGSSGVLIAEGAIEGTCSVPE